MSIFAICPCCSNKLLHHVSRHRDYWFCRSCWQEMPVLEVAEKHEQESQTPLVNLSLVINQLNRNQNKRVLA